MKPAILVVDMIKDNLSEEDNNPVVPFARAIIPNINRLTDIARKRDIPVIFSTDSFLPGDFIFGGRMKEQSLRGTEGAEVTEALIQSNNDIYLPKRRFSAFFKTDLDQTLSLYGVDTVILAGINSHWCVLSSAMDALSLDFCTYIIENCCASFSKEVHENIMNIYRKNPLRPLFQIMKLDEFLKEI
ncbi:MAG: isochorismatase family cysteine hydrolase [Syntrophales bacterium]